MGADRGTVLVVDASDDAAETADRLEAALDVTCVTAADVPTALDVLDRQDVDCVVSKYELPTGEGTPLQGGQRLLERVRERDAALPFVFVTDANATGVAHQPVPAGVTVCVPKGDRPAADGRLAEWVGTAIDQPRTTDRARRQREITSLVRDVNGALVRADTLEDVERAVTTELAGALYDVAAFVRNDVGTDDDAATLTAVSGTRSLSPGTAVDTSAVTADDVTVRDDLEGAGTPPAVARLVEGDRRVAVVPVVSAERRYGAVLLATDRGDAFEAAEHALLADLGDTVVHAVEAAETRAALERQNERLERFARVLSHDLRTPLQVANGFLESARRDRDSAALERVAAAHDRALELVDDVLTLAREGQTVVDPDPFDLETVARDAWSTVKAGDATLVVESTGRFRGDTSRVRQLLENLFRNAVEHGSKGQRVTATPEAPTRATRGMTATDTPVSDTDEATGSPDRRAGEATESPDRRTDEATAAPVTVRVGTMEGGFYVADDGPGIPPEEREDVFELGYTSSDAGTGYGLAIVAELADAHGWDVRATESDAGGARIEIRTH